METNQVVRIFISSPGDVAVERNKARKVVEALQKRYAGRLRLETVLWEDLPLGADMSFQQGIDLVLSDEHGVDIAVFILWSRLGSRLGAAFRKADGSEYRSGTEREFDLMLTARQQSPDNRPELLAYVRTDDQHFKEELMARQPDEIEEMIRQRKLAEQFIQEQFHDPQSGTNVRAYHTFPEPVSFALRLKTHLQSLLDQIAMEEGWCAGSWEGTPYRGLEVFEAEHAPIFFGRDEEVCEVLERLQAQADQGCPFVLIVGASGSGKSSLARAGVLPALETGGYDETVGVWRTAIAVPGQYGPRLCRGLAGTMLESIPELRVDDDSLSELEEVLAAGSGKALNMLLKRAFADAGKDGAVRFVLLLDQFEELFTATGTTDEEIRRFLRAVQALAFSGHVWIMATVRSDFYDRCQRFPLLMELKGDRGQMDLLPPEPSDVHRIITGPAMMAGLAFETSETGETLDQRILNDVVGHPEALPLLEFTLANLFDHRSGEGVLTFTQYKTLGGVEGAIGHHAEKVFMALSDEVRAEFGAVFNALVTLDTSDDSQPVRRRVAVETVADASTKKQLVEALVKARLLVSDRGELFVAHEALLRRWQRAVDWIEANREFLRIRQQVTQRRKQRGILVPEDPLYDAARNQMMQYRARFDEADAAFIDAAVAESEVRELRRKRLRTTVLTVLSLLTLCVFAAAGWAFRERGKAEDQTRLANEAKNKAEEQPRIAERQRILAESLLYNSQISTVQKEWENGNNANAWNLLNATNPDYRGWEFGYLYTTFNQNQQITYRKHFGARSIEAFHLNSKRIAGRSMSPNRLMVWDAESGRELLSLKAKGYVGLTDSDMAFSSCGRYLASFWTINSRIYAGGTYATQRAMLKVWDVESGQELLTNNIELSEAKGMAFSPDGTCIAGRIFTYTLVDGAPKNERSVVKVWDVESAKELMTIDEGSRIYGDGIAFSSDGNKIFTGGNKLFDVESRQELLDRDYTGEAMSVAFSPDGKRVASAGFLNLPNVGHRNPSRIFTQRIPAIVVWNAESGEKVAVLKGHAGMSSLNAVVFSPDGKRIISGGSDKLIKVWDVEHEQELLTLKGHTATHGIEELAFSPDGRCIISRDSEAVKLWDASGYSDNEQ